MSWAHPHAKNQQGWFPCAGSVTGSGSRVSEKHPPAAQRLAGSQNLCSRGPGPAGTLAAEMEGGGALKKRWGQGGLFQGSSWAVDSGFGLGLGSGSELQALLEARGPQQAPGFWALL